MKISLDRKSIVCLLVAFTLFAVVPAFQAETTASLDRHARKMEKKLSKFRPGSFVHVEFRDRNETLGSLGALSDSTFQLTSADNNRTESYAYGDVLDVHKGKQYIGEGSEPGHRPRLLVPIILSAAAAAAVVAVVEVVR